MNGDYFQGVPLNKSDQKEVPHPNYFDFTYEFNRVGYEGSVDFRFGKKPIDFLLKIFEIAGLVEIKDAYIIDSFAGSGSTAHAVLNLNQQDGGNRKFILIEMEDYAESITAERVKRVIQGYGNTPGTGGAFDYYTLGEPLFADDDQTQLNPAVGIEKLREYVWYTETRTALATPADSGPYLGHSQDTAYYFLYDPARPTTLDYEALTQISHPAGQYVAWCTPTTACCPRRLCWPNT